jgi:hypothetical protein
MSNISVNVEGFDRLVAQLKQLSDDKDKKSEVLLILRQIAKPTLDAARSIVPVRRSYSSLKTKKTVMGGNLKKSLGNITGRKTINPTIYVGPRVKGAFDGWYGHFVHDGVNVYNKGYKRKHTAGANEHAAIRKTKGNPYLTKAFVMTEGVVTVDADRRMTKFIQRRIDRLT